ncbi:MAG: hypothetical protein COV91_05795 [Candidatus Taylorbacteria bacterium CG11_big_fil_rev_8_21_14_0_20_46_11]|uniref:MOSC domain-containing protein n=1 Tax=Candidatus Taylorbacteria bacterium CG11_big_fil_rev_8_21_14_0_20_46_11 TaxID=1975025 RepID=A0A2H0KA34_9BACT|nr:MAG: hypothetical protein COV91_05795 [Candidatus Taylorbacteria bacterium CG11_big_fil_rev_8_21_14_0_20_46_11]
MIFVKEINWYPIKGCAPYSRNTDWLVVDDGGIWGNRWWVIVDGEGRMVNQKTVRKMCLVSPSLLGGTLCVECKEGEAIERAYVPVGADLREEIQVSFRGTILPGLIEKGSVSEMLSNFLCGKYRLVQLAEPRMAKTGTAQRRGDDSHPFLFISEGSLEDLNTRLETPVRMDAFRPTIVLSGCEPYEEDLLDEFQIGKVLFEGQTLCVRCNVPGIDQKTGLSRERGDGIHPFDTLQTYRRTSKGPVLGRNANHLTCGVIQEGDSLIVQKRREGVLDLESMV